MKGSSKRNPGGLLWTTLWETERRLLVESRAQAAGDLDVMAEILGVSRSAVWKKLIKHGLHAAKETPFTSGKPPGQHLKPGLPPPYVEPPVAASRGEGWLFHAAEERPPSWLFQADTSPSSDK